MAAPAAETIVQTVSSSGTPEASSSAPPSHVRGDRADRSGRAKEALSLDGVLHGDDLVDIIHRADGIEGEAAHLHALGQIEPGRSGQNERQQQPKREKQAGQPQPDPAARLPQQEREAKQDGKLQQGREHRRRSLRIGVALPLGHAVEIACQRVMAEEQQERARQQQAEARAAAQEPAKAGRPGSVSASGASSAVRGKQNAVAVRMAARQRE